MKTIKDNTFKRRLFTLIVLLCTLVGIIVCFSTGRVHFPVPFCEVIVLSRALLFGQTMNGYAIASVLFLILAFVFMCVNVIYRKKIMLSAVILCTAAVFDMLINFYCFIVASGYQWIYLVSALFDALSVLVFVMPDRSGRKKSR